MLGRTAGGLYWMSRYLERAENMARLIETGQRIALTRESGADDEWTSVLATAAVQGAFDLKYDMVNQENAVDFLLRDRDNPSSILSAVDAARTNARAVRTALTREAWSAINECWMDLKGSLARKVPQRDLPERLEEIQRHTAHVRGALIGSMMRNDIYDFCRIGTHLERADNTARILDVKYYVLLPSVASVGSSLDNVQWDTILHSVSAEGAFRWSSSEDADPSSIAAFLILDRRMPRSLAFSCSKIAGNLGYLARDYGEETESLRQARRLADQLGTGDIGAIFDAGLHEFLQQFITDIGQLGQQLETDFRFTR